MKRARDRFYSHLTKIVAGAVKQCLDAHGRVDPGSVAKRVVSRLWADVNSSEVVKHVRGLRGWSQLQLAQHLGVQPVTISRWELGKAAPRPDMLRRLKELAHEAPAH